MKNIVHQLFNQINYQKDLGDYAYSKKHEIRV